MENELEYISGTRIMYRGNLYHFLRNYKDVAVFYNGNNDDNGWHFVCLRNKVPVFRWENHHYKQMCEVMEQTLEWDEE